MPLIDKMSKKIIIYLFAACVASLLGETFLQARNKDFKGYVYDAADTSRLQSHIEFLTDTTCGGRGTGTKYMSKVTMWLNRRFKDIGLTPLGDSFVLSFLIQGGPIGRNVIGMLPYTKSYSETYTVVLAHYDGLGKIGDRYFPGADSNASGVAALLALAEMFDRMRTTGTYYEGNLLFVATDAKDYRMSGAEFLHRAIQNQYLRDPFTNKRITMDQISLVINLDQMGSTLSPLSKNKPEYLLMLGNDSLKEEYRGLLKRCNLKYGLNLDLGFSYYGSNSFTETFYRKVGEQKFFLKDKIPAVMFTSGITMNNNKIYDNLDSLDLPVLRKRILLIFKWMETIIQTNQRK